MAETGTPLQEFLVKLGYDLGDQRKFHDALQRGERAAVDFGAKVGKIGAAVVGMGVLAAKGTLRYARSLEQLNFVAQRTGTSLTHLRALQLAGASLGSSAEGAQASIEGLAHFLRSNPGSSAFLRSLGVQTQDAKGHALDTVQVMENLATRFRKMPVFMAEQYASMLGISENMMLAMRNPDFDKKVGEYTAAEGRGVNKAGRSAHALMNQERILEAHQFGLAAQAMTPAMDELTKAIQKLNDSITDTNGWLSWIMKVWSADSAMGHPAEKVAGAAVAWWAAKKLLPKAAGGSAAAGAADAAAGGGLAALARAGVGIGLLTYSPDLNPGERAALAARMKSLPGRQQYAVLKLTQMGLSEPEAIGMVANFTAESGIYDKARGDLNPKTGRYEAYGIGQWHAPRQEEFKRLFGHSIQQSTLDEQLAFSAWELKNKYAPVFKKMQAAGSDVRLQAQIVSRGYERPKDPDGSKAAARASIAQTINTTINVQGSGNPAQTAREVERAQAHVNRQLARDTAGAFR